MAQAQLALLHFGRGAVGPALKCQSSASLANLST